MDAKLDESMSDEYGRGLVTDRELEILAGEADVSEKYYGVVVTRVRGRIERLANRELPVLGEHPSLAGELGQAICGSAATPGEPATIQFPCFHGSGDWQIDARVQVESTPDGPSLEMLWLEDVGTKLGEESAREELQVFLQDGGKAVVYVGPSNESQFRAAAIPGWGLDENNRRVVTDLRFEDVEQA